MFWSCTRKFVVLYFVFVLWLFFFVRNGVALFYASTLTLISTYKIVYKKLIVI